MNCDHGQELARAFFSSPFATLAKGTFDIDAFCALYALIRALSRLRRFSDFENISLGRLEGVCAASGLVCVACSSQFAACSSMFAECSSLFAACSSQFVKFRSYTHNEVQDYTNFGRYNVEPPPALYVGYPCQRKELPGNFASSPYVGN